MQCFIFFTQIPLFQNSKSVSVKSDIANAIVSFKINVKYRCVHKLWEAVWTNYIVADTTNQLEKKLDGVEDRQTDRYFIDRKKVNPDLFVIEIEICTCIYNIVNLLKSYDNIHSMTYITKIMLTGIAIRNTGYAL